MIHGSMVEAKQGFATLEDVGLNTFLRFVQWLYHGYYDAASPRNLPASEKSQIEDEVVEPGQPDLHPSLINLRNTTDDRPLVADSFIGDVQLYVYAGRGYQPYYKEDEEKARGQSLKESFIRRIYRVRNIKKDAPQPRQNSNKREDYSEVFLGHARLYVFADKYDIQTLKEFTIEELHATLAVYTLYQERTGDIVRLLRYVYANTAETKSGVEDLRTLLTQYMEVEIDTLIKDEDLQGLMIEDGGPLLADLMKVVRNKLA